ncbi:hypothetical protein [Halobacillus litoralis]|nr:hypothetical protein [Halobacillus litoralis]
MFKYIINILKKRITPKQLKEKYGKLTTSNDTNNELIKGAQKQWNKFKKN